ncbi:MAG: low molecular weight protein arginine phosphatase [Lentisphaerae bacterium]|nr:low molecular weight protein arginine phosphatase [Lentisphaerota bacterium]
MRLDFEQLVFVCTGNTCRSPMAEHLFNALIGCGSGWQATSAGLMAGAGFPASREAIHVMQEKGLNISGHRSRLFSAEIAQSADLIIGLTNGHTQVIKAKYPRFEEKIFTL